MSVFIGYPSFMAYQMMKGKKGNNDGFPSIPGMIARYSALGLTNEQMAANPVWVDKTGNGHDLQMKNFAWKEGSGISDIYPGALVFDGVDNYGACDNFPILTKEKGYTVVALRQWLSLYEDNEFYTLLVNSNQRDKGAFAFEEFNNRSKGTFNFGNYTAFSSVNLSMPFTYQTSTSYNGKAIAIGGLKEGVNLFQVCKIGSNYCSKAAIWEIVILDHDATEEELTKIKDYFVKTYPWLFPDQAWTVTGKTNEDEDRATIANITGNDNNLVLSNFGFAGGSGYGLYAYNFNSFNLRDNVVKPTDVKKDSFRIIGTGNSSNVLVLLNTSNSAAWKIRITGMKEGDSCIVGNANKSGDYVKITKDGVYTFQKQYVATSTNGIWYNSSQEVDVLVEQIPEYEGYLVTDGVDDEVRSAAFTLNKDWTIVGNWEFITNENKNAGLAKVYSFYLYNRDYGIFVYKYTNAGQGFSVKDVKSLKAICSDGRIYLNDWQEIRNNIEQEATISKEVMAIGCFNGDFTKVAFKNLGIYNNQLLSKDDCIKAYNYLQTLKAK